MTVFSVGPGDLAALNFRARDAIDAATRYLTDRQLEEGDTVRITLTVPVTRNDQGNLIFGDVEGHANHV